MISEEISSTGNNDYTFTPDNTVSDIGINAPVDSPNHRLLNAENQAFFPVRENFILESIKIRLPYCYELADSDIKFNLQWRDQANTYTIPVKELSQNGTTFLSGVNVINTFDVFVRFPVPAEFPGSPEKLYLRYSIVDLRIAQYGVPSNENGETRHIKAILKIKHTVPLIP